MAKSSLVEKRKQKFLVDLDEILQDNVDCYIDDNGDSIPCPYTEDTVYDWIMENKEYHLLTSEYVKGMINIFMTDFKSRMIILREGGLL